jgi:hypothetical protein
MASAARRLTTYASLKCVRIHVLFPVPLGPKRKKEDFGTCSARVNIDAKFTVKMVAMSTGTPAAIRARAHASRYDPSR